MVATGSIMQSYFVHKSISEAVECILQTATDMQIAIDLKILLDYNETYEFWGSEGKPNPFPKQPYFNKKLAKERAKRGWRD